MTKAEFVANAVAASKERKRFSWIYLPLFFAILLGNIALVDLIPEKYSLLYLVLFFGFLFGNMAFTLWMARRNASKFNLKCPGCAKPLVEGAGQITIATGNCGHCGARVFEQ